MALPLPPALAPLASFLPWLDLGGIAVFAASGAIAAARQKLDFVAACFFALITAVGGGTLRDLLIGAPVFWMHDATAAIICGGVALAVWMVPLRLWPERALDLFDALGLASYAVYGAGKALHYGITPISAAAAGVITACVGGIIRDITAGTPSILMRHELYVTAAVVAAALFIALQALGLTTGWAIGLGVATGFALRVAAIRWGLSLQPHKGR